MGQAKKVTIYDVAKAAGVSASTVSRALRQPDRISSDTAARIFKTAKELGYAISGSSYQQDAALTKTFAVVVADIANPMFAGVLRGFQNEAASAGYGTVIINSEESEVLEGRAIRDVIRNVDGVALAASRLNANTINQIERLKPLVLLNRFVAGHNCVLPDTASGMSQVVTHLKKLGHSHVLYVAGPPRSWANEMRWRQLSELGLKNGLVVTRTEPQMPDVNGGRSGAEAWKDSGAANTAVVAYNDMMAAGFMAQLHTWGVAIPDEVSVVGIDDTFICDLCSPRLASLSSEPETLGVRGAQLLLWQATHLEHRGRQIVNVPIPFVTRESTGRARVDE